MPFPSDGSMYRSLTSLRLFAIPKSAGMIWANLASVLAQISGLKLLQLYEIECTQMNNKLTVAIPLLTHLIITYTVTADDAVRILTHLELPNISSLTISAYGAYITPLINLCPSLLHRITVLDLEVDGVDIAEVATMVRMLDNVRKIDIRRSDAAIIPAFLDLLKDDKFGLPHLEMAVFGCEMDSESATIMLAAFSTPRFPMRSRLIASVVCPDDWDDGDVVEWAVKDGYAISNSINEPSVEYSRRRLDNLWM